METPTFEDLDLHVQNLATIGYELIQISDQLSMLEGLLSALDSSFDEQIYQMGKALPNAETRKQFKDSLRRTNPSYTETAVKLESLKRQKAVLLVEKEQTYQMLSIGKLKIKSSLMQAEIHNFN